MRTPIATNEAPEKSSAKGATRSGRETRIQRESPKVPPSATTADINMTPGSSSAGSWDRKSPSRAASPAISKAAMPPPAAIAVARRPPESGAIGGLSTDDSVILAQRNFELRSKSTWSPVGCEDVARDRTRAQPSRASKASHQARASA